ncbi:hypothetical protein ISO56_16875 [Morganella morganii subsp. morganii]|uniref:hypothetical protein n=1 Tax=Morganella morganii TaxID=582 RepID=UPI001BDAB049|nr:hypothetical protein [Morganella morganii]MBT0502876.1 hypothetical protein [Morganella morganii subsp. morganii]QWM15858.1 hypothetical protein IZ181_05020 [Morganella morganii subsp. morganii]
MAENNQKNDSKYEIKKATLWNWVQAICTIFFVLFFLLKFYDSTFQVDFSTLLSIILAVFSIWLSATFYFKATETSNRFYENTYSHSKDIATLLVKIESGFGEKLNNLNNNYLGIKDIIQTPADHRKEIKEEMSNEIKEIEEINSVKDAIINDLLSKANIAEQESEKIRLKLKENEINLESAQNNILNLKNELSELNESDRDFDGRVRDFERYFSEVLIPLLSKNKDGSRNERDDLEMLNKRLAELIKDNELNHNFINDGIRYRYFTREGRILRRARNLINKF